MGLDALSPIAPACINALVIPIGNIKNSKYVGFVDRLRQENVVRLGDVSPYGRPHRTMFSPLAFPDGLVLYELSASQPPPSHVSLAPFEIYRLPLLVIGVADGANQVDGIAEKRSHNKALNNNNGSVLGLDELSQSLKDLQREYASALMHCILAFDIAETSAMLPEGIFSVPPLAMSRTTTIKTVMCDITSLLLAEMTTYAKSIQGLSTLRTPTADGWNRSSSVASSLPTYIGSSSRPNSVIERSRSFSPAGDLRHGHRISMPTRVPSAAEARASSLDRNAQSSISGVRTPPNNPEEINGSAGTASPPRASSRDIVRPGSLDRIPVVGPRPASMDERGQTRGKARIGVVIGALYLLAGRWPDAIKELAQSATTSKANSDYVWQAKAIDYLIVALLMCSWAHMDYRIPDVLRPSAERPKAGSLRASQHSPSNSQHEITLSKSADPEKRALTLHALAALLPELIHNVLGLYEKAWNFTEDKIPAISFSHSTIRFAKLLTALNISHGTLNDDVLSHLVMHTSVSRELFRPFDHPSFPSKSDIVALLFRAYPDTSSESPSPIFERTATLSAIARVLSELGYHRKKSLVFRDILSALIPALVLARKNGAAELGLHPAASLASLNATFGLPFAGSSLNSSDEADQGLHAFLALVCHSFGIILRKSTSESDESSSNNRTSSLALLPIYSTSFAHELAILKAHGDRDLKLDILRSCISICEALPDLAGALQCSAVLLRTAASVIAPKPESTNGSPALAIDEQIRLANNISRTLSAAQHLGLKPQEADYWDGFLIRGVRIVYTSQSHSLAPRIKSELILAETSGGKVSKNPFIYNPFLKTEAPATNEPILVANEEAVFEVILQNLYDFDVTIESIILDSEGVQLDSSPHKTIIGPYRTQTMRISATPQSPGSLTVTGCRVKVRGCRVGTFSIFSEPWALKPDAKGRDLRIANAVRTNGHPPAGGLTSRSKAARPVQGPNASSLALKVINSQPVVTLAATSLAQSAMMLLKGETTKFTITLRNISTTTPTDFLLLSFADSTEANLQHALACKEPSPYELYELELSSSREPALRWHKTDPYNDAQIKSEAETSLVIEVFGKRGLAYGIVHVDYGYLGAPLAKIQDRFYTRQISFRISFTLNASIDLVHNEVLDLTEAKPQEMRSYPMVVHEGPNNDDRDSKGSARQLKSGAELGALMDHIRHSEPSVPYCLLLLDFRNSWSSTLTLTIRFSVSLSADSADRTWVSFDHPLHPGASARIPIPIPRVYLPPSAANAPIPSLNRASKRQFVVSASCTSPEVERNDREAFWYREDILKRIAAMWKEEGTSRSGVVDLRGLKLDPAMVKAYKLNDIAITMSVGIANTTSPKSRDAMLTVVQLANQRYKISTSTFITLQTTLRNRSPSSIRSILRLQPTLANQPYNTALDMSKKLLVSGVLQRALPVLKTGETREIETSFIALSPGTYEWAAVVEEVCAPTKDATKGKDVKEGTKTGELDRHLVQEGRRTWVTERPCVVIARDER
ncbi:MAG: hypothetical protein Q9163_000681 [Psora crenata]